MPSSCARPSRRQALAMAAALAWGGPGPARGGAAFPQRPIQWLVPFAPGGIADLTARTVGEPMGRRLGQPLVIDNRPGAGGIAASQAVAGARPDGHTLLLMSNASAVSAGLFRKLPYDLERDFAPVCTLGTFDLGLFVAAGSPHTSLQALLADARARPGRLNVGTIATGSTQHLAARLFETVAGLQLLVVPYKGSPAVLTALRAGEIDVAFEILGPMLPQLEAGAVRALAVTGEARSPALPQVPTVGQAGVAGYEVSSWNALAAPAATPPEVIARLADAAREALALPDVRQRLESLGMRLTPGTPDELRARLGQEIRRWGEVIRAAGIQPE